MKIEFIQNEKENVAGIAFVDDNGNRQEVFMSLAAFWKSHQLTVENDSQTVPVVLVPENQGKDWNSLIRKANMSMADASRIAKELDFDDNAKFDVD